MANDIDIDVDAYLFNLWQIKTQIIKHKVTIKLKKKYWSDTQNINQHDLMEIRHLLKKIDGLKVKLNKLSHLYEDINDMFEIED